MTKKIVVECLSQKSSFQKRAIENFNKTIRKFLPKGTNFKNIHYDIITTIMLMVLLS